MREYHFQYLSLDCVHQKKIIILFILMHFQESEKYLRNYTKYSSQEERTIGVVVQNIEVKLLEYVLSSTPKGDPQAILDGIDTFCGKNWMMNLGEDKGAIIIDTLTKTAPKTILELGCYIGYSSLLMAYHSNALIHTFEPNQSAANVARKIHEHAGFQDRIVIHNGTIQSQSEFMKNNGIFDLIFIDHWKELYLPDFLQLQRVGAIGVGTTVIGDNMIYPGSPDYLEHMRQHIKYDSTLYYSHLEYSEWRDAVLISRRTVQ